MCPSIFFFFRNIFWMVLFSVRYSFSEFAVIMVDFRWMKRSKSLQGWLFWPEGIYLPSHSELFKTRETILFFKSTVFTLSIEIPYLLTILFLKFETVLSTGLSGSVGCTVRLETRRSWVQPPPRSATFFRGDWSWNIFYVVILSLLLIQEGQLSVSGEWLCTILVNRLEN